MNRNVLSGVLAFILLASPSFAVTVSGPIPLGTGLDIVNGQLAEVIVPNVQTGASYTLATTDANKSVNMTNASPTTVTVLAAVTAGANFGTYVYCKAGCTLARSGSDTINGGTSLVLAAGQSVALTGDGTSAWTANILPATDPTNASNLLSGTVPVTRLGSSGTRDNTTALYGDNVWRTPTGSGTGCVPSGSAGQVLTDSGAGACTSNSSLTDIGGIVTATQAVALSGTISPTALSGDVNDYAPTGNATALRLRIDAGAADRNITGLAAGATGITKIVYNAGTSGNLIINDESASSTAGNRFHLGGNNISIGVGKARAFIYDGTLSRWTNLDFGGGNTGVIAAPYTNANITVSADGRITAAANGIAGSGGTTYTFSGATGSVSSAATFFGNAASASTAIGSAQIAVDTAGNLSGLICTSSSGTQPGAATWTYTLNLNGTDNTNQVVTTTGTSTTASTGTDVAVPVVRGDLLTMHWAQSSGAATIRPSCRIKVS